jgi:hypothetical protein
MKTSTHLWSYLAQFYLTWDMFQTKGVEKIETRFMLNNSPPPPPPPANRAVWDNAENIVDSDKVQMTVWGVRIACWIPKATNTHSQCVVLIAFQL